MASARRLVTGFYLVSRLQNELDWAIDRAGEMAEEEAPADLAPPIDVIETDGSVVIVVETAGLEPADLEIETTGNRVSIRGRRPAVAPGPGPVRFHCVERRRGDFQRLVEVVGALDTREARARLAHGLLRIEIPKITDRRLEPRRIEIESHER